MSHLLLFLEALLVLLLEWLLHRVTVLAWMQLVSLALGQQWHLGQPLGLGQCLEPENHLELGQQMEPGQRLHLGQRLQLGQH